jgi:hypothetical protein
MMTTSNEQNTQVQGSRMQQAHAQLAAERAALKPEELLPITLDVPAVYTSATGTLSRLGAQREAVLALPGIDGRRVRALDVYLAALGHAQAEYLAATQPPASIPDQYARLTALRSVLVSDTTALVNRGLVPGDRLNELRGPVSQAAVAFDVLAVVTLLRAHISVIAGKTALTEADLTEAEVQAEGLLTALGVREDADTLVSAMAKQRQAAFTLFVRAYDELRRGVVFLRWHEGDADVIAPSLYAGRGGRKKKDEGDGAPAAEPGRAPAVQAAPGGASAPTADDDSPFVA